MKTTISLFLCLLVFQSNRAFEIARVDITNEAAESLTVSIDTAAQELYYFDSWRYSFTDQTITIEALFMPGFGSTIDYLNNRFVLPLNLALPSFYQLVIKAYYSDYAPGNIQDTIVSAFSTPFSGTVTLIDHTLSAAETWINPTSGELQFDPHISPVWIFNSSGKYLAIFKNNHGKIVLEHFADGVYLIGYFRNERYKVVRVILKKQ